MVILRKQEGRVGSRYPTTPEGEGFETEVSTATSPEDMNCSAWKAEAQRSPEDLLLYQYLKPRGGLAFAEVPVGQSSKDMWPLGSKVRWIDGVSLDVENERDELIYYRIDSHERLTRLMDGARVEVIEVKDKLNRPVIGQALAGAEMAMREYSPEEVTPVVVCGTGDPALEIVCERLGVKVWIAEEDS